MNYLKQLNAFYSYLESEILTSNEIALYQGLLFTNNKCGWVSAFRVSNNVLLSRTGLNKTSLNRARNRLQQLNLIGFDKGKNRYNAGEYTIKILYNENLAFHNDTLNGTLEDKKSLACQYETVNDTLIGTVNDTVTEPSTEPLLNKDINKNNNDIYTGSKKLFLDFVLLSNQEYTKLINEFGKELTEDFINRFNNYIGQIDITEAAKKYKNHYYSLKSWMSKHQRELQKKTNMIQFPNKSQASSDQQYNFDELERKALELRLAESSGLNREG